MGILLLISCEVIQLILYTSLWLLHIIVLMRDFIMMLYCGKEMRSYDELLWDYYCGNILYSRDY